ncbi:unnamed protein product [Rhizophagus irregularis]|nr:unnamed protein product [Rhizophagus irregularis]
MVANPNFSELDMAMQIWNSQVVASGVSLTDGILQQKGLELAEILNVEDQLKFPFNPKRLEKNDDEEMLDKCDNEQESSQNHRKKKIRKKAPELTNIKLVYLSPNTTAHLQLMDAGIIHSFKAKYKQEFCKHLIHQFDSGIDYVKNKLNIKEAIDYIAEGWNNVTQKTIRNCWIKTGILSTYNDDDVDKKDSELNLDDDEIENLLNHLPKSDNIIEYFQILDHEILTKENLTDEEIVNLVQADKENQEVDDDNNDDEIPVIPVKKAANALETFINFFEQQNDNEFNNEDLRILENIYM